VRALYQDEEVAVRKLKKEIIAEERKEIFEEKRRQCYQ